MGHGGLNQSDLNLKSPGNSSGHLDEAMRPSDGPVFDPYHSFCCPWSSLLHFIITPFSCRKYPVWVSAARLHDLILFPYVVYFFNVSLQHSP